MNPAPHPVRPLPDRLAYVVSHSYPYSSNGYALRSHHIARALGQAGHDVIVFNRPGRPWQIDGFDARTQVDLDQTIDGVRYIFLPLDCDASDPVDVQLQHAEATLTEAFQVFRPGAVLAASNWQTAEPARRAATNCGLDFHYEHRGFWEMSRALQNPAYAASTDYAQDQQRDTDVARRAKAVFTLNAAMRDELIRRGVPGAKIDIVPNGMPQISPRPTHKASRDLIGCRSQFLLAYSGSLSSYEGVEDLLHLVAIMRRDGCDVAAMIVGSSAASGLIGVGKPQQGPETRLQDLARSLGISDFVHLVPQMSEDMADAYYPLCDAIVLPRRQTPVTLLVPPLKPDTAAAHGVPVYMTDLPPLAEIAAETGATLFAQGDVAGLAKLLQQRLGQTPPPPRSLDALGWSQRVRVISQHLSPVDVKRHDLSGGDKSGYPHGTVPTTANRFDTRALPLVGLGDLISCLPIACIGPGSALCGAGPIISLTRANILNVLATQTPGRFVIDWIGLHSNPTGFADWHDLWSIDTMQRTRQIMDACKIALDRGWQVQVTGPVDRAAAPLFYTVADACEVLAPDTLSEESA